MRYVTFLLTAAALLSGPNDTGLSSQGRPDVDEAGIHLQPDDSRGECDKREIQGLTAIASDPSEAEPGSFVLQGDHGPVEFRRMLTPLGRR